MATTTTNFGWDIPQSTDLVKDGATAIAALGQDIDTAFVDFKGGTTGQVLKKTSGTDLDVEWGTVSSGLTLINTTSFSAVASQSINTVFSATYDNYKIFISNLQGNGAIEAFSMRLRKSGSDNSSNIYYRQAVGGSGTSGQFSRAQGTSWVIGGVSNQGPMVVAMEIFGPQLASQKTNALSMFQQGSTSVPELQMNAYQHDLASSADFDGFTIFPGAGTITGIVSVYGYNE
jgi:hypothetical protein